MPKYDAFGREIGEDTLAGLGGSSEPAAQPSSEPAGDWTEAQLAAAAADEAVAEAEPVPSGLPPRAQADATPPRPEPVRFQGFDIPTSVPPVVRVRRRGGAGCFGLLIVVAVIVAAPILALVGTAGDAIDEIKDTIDSAPDIEIPQIPEPDAPAGPATPPHGITGRSMVAKPNFGKALGKLDGMGRVAFIRLSPDRVDSQLVKGSRQRSAQVNFEGELARSPAGPASGTLATVAFAAIDRAAPARLVRGSARRYSVRPNGIDYLVLSPWPGEGHRWVAYFKNGVYVQGDRNGRVVRKISGP